MRFPTPRGVICASGVCLAAAMLFAACGGGGDSPSKAASSPPAGSGASTTAPGSSNTKGLTDNGAGVACPLLTTVQVAEATGTAMKDGVGQGGGKASFDACEWTAAKGNSFVTLNFYKQDAQKYYDEGTTNGTTPVPAVGTKSRWTPGLARLEVLQGNYYFTVAVTIGAATPDAALLTAAKSVAGNVLKSLP